MLVGDTVIAAVVAVVLHRYVPPPEAVKVAEGPAQIVPSLFVVPDWKMIVYENSGGLG